MKNFLIGFTAVLGIMFVWFILDFALNLGDLAMFKFFAPKVEQVRRETFEQSKAYRSGSVQELENMQFEYIKADPAHKAALASIIRHRAADLPSDALPSDLYSFIKNLP